MTKAPPSRGALPLLRSFQRTVPPNPTPCELCPQRGHHCVLTRHSVRTPRQRTNNAQEALFNVNRHLDSWRERGINSARRVVMVREGSRATAKKEETCRRNARTEIVDRASPVSLA